MKKIAIIGSGGAGKSTLARQLSEKLGIVSNCGSTLDIRLPAADTTDTIIFLDIPRFICA